MNVGLFGVKKLYLRMFGCMRPGNSGVMMDFGNAPVRYCSGVMAVVGVGRSNTLSGFLGVLRSVS